MVGEGEGIARAERCVMGIAGGTLKPLVKLGRNPADCWTWLGPKNQGGYGKKTFDGGDLLAHRWIWMQLFGPIAEGLVIHHTCNNPGCINPHHLVVTTQAENVREGVGTTLTPGDVTEIKAARKGHGPNTANALANRFGVTPQLIRDIWHGRAWSRPKPFYGPRKAA
jgi:hypothetical protein